MTFTLPPRAESAGYRLIAFDAIGSTNAEGRQHAQAGESGPLWIAARQQTAGRGRRGRRWQTEPGNLAATLMMQTDLPLANAAMLGFVAGLAVVEALALCAPSLNGRLRLKWPNDVLVDEAKISGILLESEPVANGNAIIIGIGINVVSAPKDVPYPATSLAALGMTVKPEVLFSALSEAWIGFMKVWDQGRNTSDILSRWRGHAAGLGATVSIQLGGKVVSGIFESLDEQGRLILRGNDKSLAPIAAGDVYFGDVATTRQAEAC